MARYIPKRMTADLDGPFAVFLIGMRINSLLRVHHWLPLVSAMPKMMKELYENPELGMLGHEGWFGRTTMMVQYWRSVDHLMDYAKSRDHEHLPAWREFNRRAQKATTVGIWHETFIVEPGAYESVYFNMPRFGLARAGDHVEAIGHRTTARGRLGAADKKAA